MAVHLESLRNELADLDISIIHHRSGSLTELEERRADVQAKLDAFIFPILTLPPEITAEIFLHDVSAILDYNHQYHRNPCRNILRLLLVCRGWRALALSVPALWSTLDLGLIGFCWKAPEVEMEGQINGWFERAAALPLFLTWTGTTKEDGSGHIASIIERYAPRLEFLSLGLYSGNLSIPLLPSLRTLHLSDHTYIDGLADTPGSSVLTLREAPQLRNLVLYQIPPMSLVVPWELLESFIASVVSPQHCLDVLRSNLAPSADLLVAQRKPGNDAVSRTPYSQQSGVEILHIGRRPLPSILSRTRGSLLTFTVNAFRRKLSQGTILLSTQCFQYMKHLTGLHLAPLAPQSRAAFVRALNRQHEPEFLPALEKLTLTHWKPDELDTQLVDALASRCTATEAHDGQSARMQLRSFRFIWESELSDNVTPSFASALASIHDHGVALHIGSEDKNYLKIWLSSH
ncbi:hypothetical protein C8F04DRAFT_1251264 [Mycena alexandri]|uniref:F-box domain-containing protein n=1 Tax=Mycena alexandri TaxID=1745969 RepID=A0AAD6TAY3_9AGAR|nr:hypothetical protein C8F04DRAFT_1251264 [Mycena alexandri]